MDKINTTVLIFVLFGISFHAYASDIPPHTDYQKEFERQQKELISLEKDLGAYRNDIEDLAEKEKELKGKISHIEKKISGYKGEEADILKKMKKVDTNMVYQQAEMKKARASSGKYRDIFRKFISHYNIQKNKCDSMPWFGPILCDVHQDLFIQKLMVMLPAERYAQVNREIQTITSLNSELQEENNIQNILREQLLAVKKNLIIEKKRQLQLLNSTEGERRRIKILVASKGSRCWQKILSLLKGIFHGPLRAV